MEMLLRTRGRSGLYLRLTPASWISPLLDQSAPGLLPGTTAGASWLSLVNSRVRSRELMKALKVALMFISMAINVADMKTLDIARPAVAADTEPLEATQTPPVMRTVVRAVISILHMNHWVARWYMLSAEMLVMNLQGYTEQLQQ